jgi:hypothetical protein
MSNDTTNDTAPSPQPSQRGRIGELASRLGFAIQFFGAIAIAVSVIIYLMTSQGHHPKNGNGKQRVTSHQQAVEFIGEDILSIDPTSLLAKKLAIHRVKTTESTTPLLKVNGAVAASLRPVGTDATEQWQFNDPAALEAFYAWRRALVDIQFAQEQVERLKQLLKIRVESRQAIVERLRRLVVAGTDSRADLQLAEADLLEAETEGLKDVRTAEVELSRAQKDEAVASRNLQLMGLDVGMLSSASSDVDIVIAEVPEEHGKHVKVGQKCEARFARFASRVYPGTVQMIAPTLSLERRALRVMFFVDDPDDELRPGMFAEIGLGTDPRQSLIIPAESVIHIGRDDFVFVRHEPTDSDPSDRPQWRLVTVEVGDSHSGMIEVLDGLQDGDEIISDGAILLKPLAAAALRTKEASAR